VIAIPLPDNKKEKRMKDFKYGLLALVSIVLFSACGAKKRLQEAENRYASLDSTYRALRNDLAECQDSSAYYRSQVASLQNKVQEQETSNNRMVEQLENLSVISSSQAESINKS